MWDNWRDKLSNLKDFHDGLDELGKLGGSRIWIIHVLDDCPKNGIEIINTIHEHRELMYEMNGQTRWNDNKHHDHHLQKRIKHSPQRLSPGSVYPMLKKMVSEDLIVKQKDGRYKLTDKGEKIAQKIFGRFRSCTMQMDRGEQIVEHVLNEISGDISFLEGVKKEKLISHEELIEESIERLKKMKDSLKEE